jgi:hypothetical protein
VAQPGAVGQDHARLTAPGPIVLCRACGGQRRAGVAIRCTNTATRRCPSYSRAILAERTRFLTMSNSQRYAARSLRFSGAGRRPFPFSCSLAGEGDGAPGGAGRLGERPADRGAVRHAPWRRRVHPNDVGVRRLPALHRGASAGPRPPAPAAPPPMSLGPRMILGASTYLFMICSFALRQARKRAPRAARSCDGDLVRSAIRRRVLRTRPCFAPDAEPP